MDQTTEATAADVRPIAFVQAAVHKELVDKLWDAFRDHLAKAGVADTQLEHFEVPGSFELPLQAQVLAHSGRYQAIVAGGLIVDGGIYRHEFVADAVINGLMRAQLDSGVPVLSAVLTPQRFHEHRDHLDFFAQHLQIKGVEVAEACLATCANLARARDLTTG